MILGTVVGHVWATRKTERAAAKKLVLVRLDRAYRYSSDHCVAVDDVGAEIGHRVLVCVGAPPRWQLGDVRMPVDAGVCAIVDGVELAPPAEAAGGAR